MLSTRGVQWLEVSVMALSMATTPSRVPAMSLAEALVYARAHTPSLAAQRARVQVAVAESRAITAQWLPRLSVAAALFGGTTNNSTASVTSLPGIDLPRVGATSVGAVSYTPSPSTIAAVGLRQEVFDFGRIAAARAATDALATVEQERAYSEGADIELAVEEAFLAVKAAAAVVAAAEGAFERARISRDTARAGVQSGLRKPIELTRAEADLSRFDVGRVRAQGALTAARAVFAAVVGLSEPALDASGDAPPRDEPPTVAQAFQTAEANEPSIRVARAAVAAQQARSRAISSERRPDLFASAAFSGRAGGATPSSGPGPYGGGWLPLVPNWDVGLVLSWPVLDFVSMAKENVSSQLEHVREAELRLAEQRLMASVQQSFVAYDAAKQALPVLERQLEAAKDNHAQAQARFNAGLAQALELADAEAVRIDAEIQLALGRFELARNRARLARASAEGVQGAP